MYNAVATQAPNRKIPGRAEPRPSVSPLAQASLVVASALLLILSFPNFKLWPLAWIGLVPFLLVVARPLKASRAFLLGWLWGGVFFYGTCWWLSYPMIRYAHISPWLTYPLLILPIAVVALFPGLFSLALSRLVGRLGLGSICLAPLLWVSTEWARYALTGQLWNALGYSQAFHPLLIQPARWGGVYMISFLLLAINVAVAFIVLRPNISAVILSLSLLIVTALVLAAAVGHATNEPVNNGDSMLVIAVQPNVPMEGLDDPKLEEQLLNRHVELSLQGLRRSSAEAFANRLVIWPESPMNFSYSREPHLRDVVTDLARNNHTLVLLNSLEPAPNGGEHNSALLINEEGRIVAQYDKIRLMPFGEYVPLPRWLPGASSVRGFVGDFTPGSSYTLMPLGAFRAGVFICIEAAHPGVARAFAGAGVDALINISNDGYLGPTPVMRQHLANAIFRAVENDQQLLRVTNSGVSAYIDSRGKVSEETSGFEQTVRSWPVRKQTEARTFYTAHGDLFAYACAIISLGLISATFITRRMRVKNSAAEARP